MTTFDRRRFLATVSCSLTGQASAPFFHLPSASQKEQQKESGSCWLDVVAPFIVEDSELGVESEVVLTSDTFVGTAGHADQQDSTDYEIYLYDMLGRAVGVNGIARRMTVNAMNTTVIPVRELIGDTKKFCGGMKIRLRPKSRKPMHATDLFSSAFVRWRTANSFDTIHANPDPLHWQTTESFFYSMPYPSLAEYECVFSIFNPNSQRSAGELRMTDSSGKQLVAQRYELRPHASLLFDLNAGNIIKDPWALSPEPKPNTATNFHKQQGLLSAINEEGTTKCFGFLMIRRNAQKRFSVEHPIHQGVFKQQATIVPLDEKNQFKAKNVLYTPLMFRNKKIATANGNLTFDSKFYLGAGLPLEESLWLLPFAIDEQGKTAWFAKDDKKLSAALPSQTERGLIKLGPHQSCCLDFAQLSLPAEFSSGGLAVAVSPDTNHTLFKAEVRVSEWNAYAFTHFRPGLRSARRYQKPKERGGLATDYIVSGARVVKGKPASRFDELVCVLNIDDQGWEGRPVLELFGARGAIKRIPLGTIPPFGCRHFLLSDLIEANANYEPLSLRLTDEEATLLMSVIHIDYQRRDIALDHGSDRFSTFLDFVCQ